MRRTGTTIVALSILCCLISCEPSEQKGNKNVDIRIYNWGTTERTMLEKGMFHSSRSLDTASNQLVGDTLLPVMVNDTSLILRQLKPLKMELKTVDGIEDFYITATGFKSDTFLYDVKNYMDRFFLIMVSPNASTRVYELKNNNSDLTVTNNISFPHYEIEGYAVGDAVERDEIKVISRDQFGSILTEKTVLQANNNVILTLKGGKYIEQIQWIAINDVLANEIIGDLNSLFTKPPDIEYYIDFDGEETEEIIHYYYSENEVNVLLSKADEYGDFADSWTLTYTNLIISDVLNNFLEEEQVDL